MIGKIKVIVAALSLGLMLGGCSEITEYFLEGDPSEVSSCEFIDPEEGLLCVECNSADQATGEAEYCGTTLKVRCSSDIGDDVFAVAVGGYEGASLLTATAWVDSDGTSGPSEEDELVCHAQSADFLGKQEYKCTTALKGSGKDATAVEAEIKYDPAKDDCDA